MDRAVIADLLQPFLEGSLSPAQLDQISTYIDLLQRWNTRINLTAIRKPEEMVARHFGESLFLARHVFPAHSPQTARVVDLGSGAGFPALPLKIWAPEVHLSMIESNHKKGAFLREVIRSLTLTNVNVYAERAEDLVTRVGEESPSSPSVSSPPGPSPTSFEKADVVTFRAVEKFEQTLQLATKFLRSQGRLAILITKPQFPIVERITTADPISNIERTPNGLRT